MRIRKTYLAKIIYSVIMGVVMGFVITSVFLVIITNVDKYFFNNFIGISGDWVYIIGTFVLVPIFGIFYVYNKRIVIDKEVLVLRENSFSFMPSSMNISSIKSISLHEQQGRKRVKKGIKFADGDTAIMVLTKPFSDITISLLLKDIHRINPDLIIDDYYMDIMRLN